MPGVAKPSAIRTHAFTRRVLPRSVKTLPVTELVPQVQTEVMANIHAAERQRAAERVPNCAAYATWFGGHFLVTFLLSFVPLFLKSFRKRRITPKKWPKFRKISGSDLPTTTPFEHADRTAGRTKFSKISSPPARRRRRAGLRRFGLRRRPASLGCAREGRALPGDGQGPDGFRALSAGHG